MYKLNCTPLYLSLTLLLASLNLDDGSNIFVAVKVPKMSVQAQDAVIDFYTDELEDIYQIIPEGTLLYTNYKLVVVILYKTLKLFRI